MPYGSKSHKTDHPKPRHPSPKRPGIPTSLHPERYLCKDSPPTCAFILDKDSPEIPVGNISKCCSVTPVYRAKANTKSCNTSVSNAPNPATIPTSSTCCTVWTRILSCWPSPHTKHTFTFPANKSSLDANHSNNRNNDNWNRALPNNNVSLTKPPVNGPSCGPKIDTHPSNASRFPFCANTWRPNLTVPGKSWRKRAATPRRRRPSNASLTTLSFCVSLSATTFCPTCPVSISGTVRSTF